MRLERLPACREVVRWAKAGFAEPSGKGIAMIVGTGTDLTEIARIDESIKRFGRRFLDRIYTESEIRYCQRKKKTSAESFAARFAAKEAGAKALGTGIARGVGWREIEVGHLPGGRPTLRLHGRAAERAAAMGAVSAHVSLTHTREMALATVILESAAVAGQDEVSLPETALHRL